MSNVHQTRIKRAPFSGLSSSDREYEHPQFVEHVIDRQAFPFLDAHDVQRSRSRVRPRDDNVRHREAWTHSGNRNRPNPLAPHALASSSFPPPPHLNHRQHPSSSSFFGRTIATTETDKLKGPKNQRRGRHQERERAMFALTGSYGCPRFLLLD